jgi:hypothetical protein
MTSDPRKTPPGANGAVRRLLKRARRFAIGDEDASPLQRAAAMVEAAIVAVIVAVLLFSLITYFEKVREVEDQVKIKYLLAGSEDRDAYQDAIFVGGGGGGALASPTPSGVIDGLKVLTAQLWADALKGSSAAGFIYVMVLQAGSEAEMCNATAFKVAAPAYNGVIVRPVGTKVARLSIESGLVEELNWADQTNKGDLETEAKKYIYANAVHCLAVVGNYYSLTYTMLCDGCALSNLRIESLAPSANAPPPPGEQFMDSLAIGDTDPTPPPGICY